MGLIIKKRFGPRNFVQQLDFKHVYSIGSKPRKKQQVLFKNPLEYIQPQTPMNDLTREVQQGFNTYQKGANTSFANYYGGSGDTRGFVWTAKPLPPVATSLDRLASDFDRNNAITTLNNKRMFNLAEALAGQRAAYFKELAQPSTAKSAKGRVQTWVRNTKYEIKRDRLGNYIADTFREGVLQKHRLPGYFKTWYTRSLNLDDPAVKLGRDLQAKRTRELQQGVLSKMYHKAMRTKGTMNAVDRRTVYLARKVFSREEKKRVAAMAERRQLDEATEGGFMAQVGTNLVAGTRQIVRQLIPPEGEPTLMERGMGVVSSGRDKLQKSAEKLRAAIKEIEDRGETPPH